MTRSEYRINKVLSYIWLVPAVAAVLGAFLKGAWLQLLLAAICITMYVAMRPRKWVHIPGETYDELNKQIYDAVSKMEEGMTHVVVGAQAGDQNVSVIAELHANVTSRPFYDDAWGYRKKFMETNFYCCVKIVSVKVFDPTCRHELDSDFDEDFIESEYETTEWK